MKYLIYLRVSTVKQDEETQLDHCLRFIKQRDSTDFKYEVFRDKITSKKGLFKRVKKGDGEITIIPRPGAKAMMGSIRKGDLIVAHRIDRLARRSYETHQLIDILEKLEADIVLVDQPGIKNKIMLGLYAGMAEEEVVMLRKRVRETLETKKNKRERYSRFLPYGYGLHETKLVPIRVGDEVVMKRGILIPIHEEQQVLAKMAEYADQGMTHQAIAKALTAEGHMNREGKPWQKMSIYRILARRESATSQDQPQEQRESLASR